VLNLKFATLDGPAQCELQLKKHTKIKCLLVQRRSRTRSGQPQTEATFAPAALIREAAGACMPL
jgi:hypothetical protein